MRNPDAEAEQGPAGTRTDDDQPESTKVTVKFSPKSVDALTHAASLVGLNKTDTVNRAVQLYDFVVGQVARNKDSVLIIERNGKQERIRFL